MSDTEDSLDPADGTAADPNIVRMYRADDAGALVFREAWVDEGEAGEDGAWFVVNHGTVGRQSTSDETAVDAVEEAFGMLAAFREQCVADGYAELPREDQFVVVAQFALKNDRVTDRDRHLEARVREALTAHLAWRGSGIVEKTEFKGGAHGTGKLNIYILAPDAARAVANIKVCIREEKLDFTKLSVASAPATDLGALKAKHGPAGATFSL
ncbi:hypothetical protein [Arthrobacter dokdonensis]|uniref:hypothetical protein n=1 Tax=Arthrobacter dokdonellae TaxID=2211210 RepID=UPI000DE5BA44|nr:hypothetical protein [Arthrobacter dokdonellae]